MRLAPALLVLALALLPALAGCLQPPGSIDDNGYRPRTFTVEQVGASAEGVATLRLVSRAPMMTRADVLLFVDGEPRVDETTLGCPPSERAWAWCGDDALRAGDFLQVRAEAGSVLRVVDAQSNSVVLTLVMR